MGWAASPARVMVPFLLSHGSVGQYVSRLCQQTVSSGMESMACFQGSAYLDARSFMSARIAGPWSASASSLEGQLITML
jgi:hypothetical protein